MSQRWRGRRLSVSPDFVREALEWRRKIKAAVTVVERERLKAPSAADLARKHGVSHETARKYLFGRLPKRVCEEA